MIGKFVYGTLVFYSRYGTIKIGNLDGLLHLSVCEPTLDCRGLRRAKERAGLGWCARPLPCGSTLPHTSALAEIPLNTR